MKTKINHWLRAIGLFRGFWLVSLIPVSMGATVAWWEVDKFSPGLFALTLITVWAVHIGTNLINDYYDHISGTDDINQVITPFSGGTRVIQENLLPPKQIRNVGYLSFAVSGALFILLAAMTGWTLLIFAALGLFSGIGYSAKPLWLSYRGVGEFLIFLNFGPLLVLASYYTQTLTFSFPPLAVGIVLGLFSSAIITINEIPDIDADTKTGKNNLVVRYGKAFGITLWSFLLWSAVLLIIPFCISGLFPLTALVGLLAAIPIFLLTWNVRNKTSTMEGIVTRCKFSIFSFVGAWLLLSAGFFASGIMT